MNNPLNLQPGDKCIAKENRLTHHFKEGEIIQFIKIDEDGFYNFKGLYKGQEIQQLLDKNEFVVIKTNVNDFKQKAANNNQIYLYNAINKYEQTGNIDVFLETIELLEKELNRTK